MKFKLSFSDLKIHRIRADIKNDHKVGDVKLINDICKTQHCIDNSGFINSDKRIVVLDTNVLLSNHTSLEKIFSNDEYRQNIFIFPWVVVQELDNCKRSKYSKQVNKKAQMAIRLIHRLLQLSEKERQNFIFETSIQV